MQILLVAATDMEVDALKAEFNNVEFLITGVGAPACLYALTKTLRNRHYDLVIQAGIAGSFDDSLILGETVMIKQDLFADLGFAENGHFYSLNETDFATPDAPPYKKGWLVNESEFTFCQDLKKVAGITVNTVSDDLLMAEKYQKKYDAKAESMEGAAFHYACIMEAQPFIQLRGISNKVGERDKSKWSITETVTSLHREVSGVINSFNQQS